MKDLVVFGNDDFARMLKYYIEQDDSRSVVCFTVDSAYIHEDVFCGVPVVPFDVLVERYPPERFDILLGVGYSRMNDVRKEKFAECKQKGYTIASFIHSSSRVHTTDIGEGNIILENSLVYPFSSIGDGNLIWDNVSISHDSKIGSFNNFAGGTSLCGYVTIGNNCYFGKNSILDNDLCVADYTLIGAGAYARGTTQPYDVIVPERSITLAGKKSTSFL